MIVLVLIPLFAGALAFSAWTFMILVGMAHIHLLEAINPISYTVSLQFGLVFTLIGFLSSMIGSIASDK